MKRYDFKSVSVNSRVYGILLVDSLTMRAIFLQGEDCTYFYDKREKLDDKYDYEMLVESYFVD